MSVASGQARPRRGALPRAGADRRQLMSAARLLLGALALALGVAGCGETVATNSFKGEAHAVAQRISNFQKHATESSQKKICEEDLASELKARIEASGKACSEALKEQLKDVEVLTVTVQSVAVHDRTATATVKSTWSGKTEVSTLKLVKEGEDWKISGLA
jgi:Domain of unknown function (DUF4878)